MKSTKPDQLGPMPYLGVDLTSRYGNPPRPVDVCALRPEPRGGLQAFWWQWHWDQTDTPLQLAPLLDELRTARSVMVDGPQALAARGRRVRVSERLCRAAGKTPDRLPPDGMPYAGFIRSSVEWFAAIHAVGLTVSPPHSLGGVCEYYPGEGWVRLSQRRLPNKRSAVGRKVRQDLLRRYGVRFPRGAAPGHDELDACLGALLAAAADGAVAGLGIETVGLALQAGTHGLREGPIVLPQPSSC